MNKLIVLSTRNCDKRHQPVSYNTILGLENEFINVCGADYVTLSNKIEIFNRIWNKIFKTRPFIDRVAISKVEKSNGHKIFFAAMGIGTLEKYISTLKRVNNKLIIYIFDCWEPQWGGDKEAT